MFTRLQAQLYTSFSPITPDYRQSHCLCKITKAKGKNNKPFYSWRLNTLAFKWMWGSGWPCLDTKLPLFSYRNCAWKILVSIRTTWFTQESRKSCIKARSIPASFLSNLNWERQPQAVRMQARTSRARHSKEQVACTSANWLKRWEYWQNTFLSFYLTISSFILEILHLFKSISNFLGLLRSAYA